jgi:NTE family protein
MERTDESRIALVLAGGGARGAYEAGALSVLLPVLEERGERPRMIIGTSVGAITAAFMASAGHASVVDAMADGLGRWRQAEKDEVLGSVLLKQAPLAAAKYLGNLLSIGDARLSGLLDTSPLRENLHRWIDWDALGANLDSGIVELLAVVATGTRSGRTTVFIDSSADRDAPRSNVVDYVPARIGIDHIMASAAIPILFPPVRVNEPHSAAGWYLDGGVRFNTPIKPALDLGAERVVVVGTGAIDQSEDPPADDADDPPAIVDAAVNLLHGTLVDPLLEDLRNVGNINLHYVTEDGCPTDSGPAQLRRAERKRPYRRVPYLFTGPRRTRDIGELATAVFERRYGGMNALRSLDFGLLNTVFKEGSTPHGELLSYLFFDAEFIDQLIEMGREDCERWLRQTTLDGGDIWRIGPPEESFAASQPQ